MSKIAIFAIFCLCATAMAFDMSRFNTAPITEADIQELFGLYVRYLAPTSMDITMDRYNFFKSKVLRIVEHNRNPEKTHTLRINKYTGFTLKELEGVAIMAPQNCSATNTISLPQLNALPEHFDWRLLGVVSHVKDQGHCGSCWTFSTTGAIEANWAIVKGRRSPLLAEQQLVDCAGAFNNFGCDGGLPSQAFEYIKWAGGIESESSYPYTAKDGKCQFDKSKTVAEVPYGSANITSGDEGSLLTALFGNGPISVAFEVTDDFVDYDGGVYVGQTCHQDTDHVNHAVLAVGFGKDSKTGLDYWIVKNSWGTGWGEEGYFRIQRGTNMCGLAVCASFPQIRQPRL